MMNEQKDAGLWIRLSHAEKEEIKRESDVSGHNMSEIARQRLFSDPIAVIERRLELLERRSLSQVAWSNLIAELVESMVPKNERIGKTAIQKRLDELKALVIKAERSKIIFEAES